ncbi:MAG: hypothetical protein EOP85_08255, partial [Verrucomicrobiaceae bacterium]
MTDLRESEPFSPPGEKSRDEGPRGRAERKPKAGLQDVLPLSLDVDIRPLSVDLLLDNFDRLVEAPKAITRLRQYLLDLAIRGKLVEQTPHDEPASELLKRIAAEKVRAIAAGEFKKDKERPPLNKSETFIELPTGWEWSQLAEVGWLSPRNRAEDSAP